MNQKKQATTKKQPSPVIGILFMVFAAATIILFFVNFGWAIISLIVAFILWRQTPQGKNFQAKRIAAAKQVAAKAEQAQAEAERTRMELEQKFHLLTQHSNDSDLLAEVLNSLANLPVHELNFQMRKIVLPLLFLLPLNDHVRESAFTLVRRVIESPWLLERSFSLELSRSLYDSALLILEQNPIEPKIKQFVLDVGRWHFGKLRGGGPTIYDEQAIQNDIIVRSR